MNLLDLTLDDPAANVALDDALVETADARLAAHDADDLAAGDGAAFETLRLWEPAGPMVVLGRSSRIAEEVDVNACREAGVAIIRRASGGATIVAAPGCLMYAVVLSYRVRPGLRAIDAAHRFVLERVAAGLRTLTANVVLRGTSDLAIVDDEGGERKVSGNSMRCRRDFLLYHGTLLYDFPLDLVGRLLRMPPRQPDYRQGRGHGDFVANLPATQQQLRRAIAAAFGASETATDWPQDEVARLVREKYGTPAWTNLL
jgi:lipoate-protein ligase A